MSQRLLTVARTPRFIPRRPGIFRLVLLLIILFAIIGYISPVKDYVEKSRLIANESNATAALKEQHNQLLIEKERLLNNEYVERIARKDLGMVRPGEEPFVVRDLEKDESPSMIAGNDEAEKSFLDRAMETITSLLP